MIKYRLNNLHHLKNLFLISTTEIMMKREYEQFYNTPMEKRIVICSYYVLSTLIYPCIGFLTTVYYYGGLPNNFFINYILISNVIWFSFSIIYNAYLFGFIFSVSRIPIDTLYFLNSHLYSKPFIKLFHWILFANNTIVLFVFIYFVFFTNLMNVLLYAILINRFLIHVCGLIGWWYCIQAKNLHLSLSIDESDLENDII
jgi:hypothetical protein